MTNRVWSFNSPQEFGIWCIIVGLMFGFLASFSIIQIHDGFVPAHQIAVSVHQEPDALARIQNNNTLSVAMISQDGKCIYYFDFNLNATMLHHSVTPFHQTWKCLP